VPALGALSNWHAVPGIGNFAGISWPRAADQAGTCRARACLVGTCTTSLTSDAAQRSCRPKHMSTVPAPPGSDTLVMQVMSHGQPVLAVVPQAK
jgi:hypothetical protein